jgi:hypothetical protein
MAFSGLNVSFSRYGFSGTKLLEGFRHAHSVYRFRRSVYRLRLRRYRSPVDATDGARQHYAHLSGASLRCRQINQPDRVGHHA